ncbi:MAG: Dna2/Cas4 domain-containing protein [Anaerolineaceae bacterium]
MMDAWLPIVVLLFLAFLFFFLSGRKKRQSGMPQGKVVYADNDQWQTLPAPLYDPQLRLTGKPDYIVALKDRSQVPVEVKTGLAPSRPYDSHIMQLAAYCWLIEQTSGSRPPYGLLHYSDKTFQVEYTPGLESGLVKLVAEIRRAETCPDGPARSHQEAARCRRCGYRNSCDERL